VRSSRASSGVKGFSGKLTNSENEGTLFNLSLKYVGRRLGVDSGVSVAVAKDREEDAEMKDRDACRKGGALRHLNLVAFMAIMYI